MKKTPGEQQTGARAQGDLDPAGTVNTAKSKVSLAPA
jgi:hypothetical protein